MIAECLAHGSPPSLFEEQQGWVVVTFRASIVPAGAGRVPPESREKNREKSREKILRVVGESPAITIQETAQSLGLNSSGKAVSNGSVRTRGAVGRWSRDDLD